MRRRAFLVATMLLAALQWRSLRSGAPWVTRMEGWFWRPTHGPAWPPWLLLGVAGAVAVATIGAVRGTSRPWLRVAGLGALAWGLQLGMAWSEGRGLDALRDRVVKTGHAEFVITAVRERETPGFLRAYHARAEVGALGRFAPSKPPGQLFLYMATESLSRPLAVDSTPVARVEALRKFAVWTWPLIAALAVAPLYVLGLTLTGRRDVAVAGAALYAVVPAVGLITLHTDQVFYPLLVTLAALSAAVAARRAALAWSFAAGVTYAGALFCSFGLLAATPVLLALLAARSGDAPGPWPWGRAALRVAAWSAGLTAAYVVLLGLGGYDWLEGYRLATDYHLRWKGWDGRAATVAHFALVDALDYGLWIGAPLALAAILSLLFALAGARRAMFRALPAMRLSLGLVFVALLAFGRTKGETGRLWMFLTPFVCVSVAAWLREIRAGRGALALLLSLEVATMYFAKRFMDFR